MAGTPSDHHPSLTQPPVHDESGAVPVKACLNKENVGWRRVVRNFTPSWFSVNMGTGIVSILLHNLPYNTAAVQYISYVFFVLNIVLFSVFFFISLARYLLYPEIWGAMIQHQNQSLFLGCFPMGFATIINMLVFVCAPWGDWMVYLAWGLWWMDVVLSLGTCLTLPFVVAHHHKTPLHNTTAAYLLPIVPVVVISATGGIIAQVLPNPDHAVTTIVVSYILWGLGQSFAMMILGIYFLRLQLHDLPPKEAIVSVFLPIGVLGQGGFGIQQLGRVSLEVLPRTAAFGAISGDDLRGGEVLYVLGVFMAFLMWGAALGWLSFALITIWSIKSFPFNMGWWGFTFPLGVFTTCTSLLAKELSSPFFTVVTMILSCAVVLLWLIVAIKTARLALTGEMFFAPCLKDLRQKSEQADGDRVA